MLLIKTYIEKSVIHGIGLYADEAISKGQVIARLNDFDIKVSVEDVPESAKPLFDFYFSRQGGQYQTYIDNMRFMNHADKPNCIDSKDGTTIAIKDIKKGEELTCDYSFFCDLWQNR